MYNLKSTYNVINVYLMKTYNGFKTENKNDYNIKV